MTLEEILKEFGDIVDVKNLCEDCPIIDSCSGYDDNCIKNKEE